MASTKKILLRLSPYIVMVVLGLIVMGAMFHIQFVKRSFWQELAKSKNNVTTDHIDKAKRGNIYSSDGNVLATSVPVCNLYLDFMTMHDTVEVAKGQFERTKTSKDIDSLYEDKLDEVCAILSEVTGKDPTYYANRMNAEYRKKNPPRFFLVERNLPYSQWIKIASMKGWRKMVAQNTSNQASIINYERAHIYGNMAENCIGFSNSRDLGTYTGIEGYYDTMCLRGTDGIYRYRRLTRGVWLPVSAKIMAGDSIITESVKCERVDGSDIVATIDTRYQDVAENALRKVLRDGRFAKQDSRGCAVLMEVKTGYVAACVNLAWDSVRQDFREIPNSNIAVSELYEPGSTFKTVILTAMMADKSITIDTSMMMKAGERTFTTPDTKIIDDHKDDSLPVSMILTRSSNVAMCGLGWQYYRVPKRSMVLDSLARTVYPYEVLNLDIRALEPQPWINNLRYDRDFLNFCYGYSTNTTAMQLVTFYNALANGGKMVKPQFCKGIMTDNGFVPNQPIVLKPSIISEENLKKLHSMLVDVVDNEKGTGHKIKSNRYSIAGKTGTASLYSRTGYNSSFVGYFPAENPRYTCIVVVKNVTGHGSEVAMPVFKTIADCVVSLDKDIENGKLEVGSGVGERKFTTRYAKPNRATDNKTMPNCYGMTIREAMEVLHARGLKVSFTGRGRVYNQSIRAGRPVEKGAKVDLVLKQM